jgi:DNA-binding CsgD family transcriptional regulator
LGGGPSRGNPRNLGFPSEADAFNLQGMAQRERQRRRARERLEALTAATIEPEDACRAAIDILRPAVGFERWCWPRTDPGSALATGGLAEFDLWPELPRIAALEEHGDITSKPRLLAGPRPSVALSAATGGDLARSTRWRECLRPYGISDELMTVCCDRHGCWGSVELMRDAGDRPFDDDDVDFLARLAPTLALLLRRSQRRAWHGDRSPAPAPTPGALVLDAELRPTSWTPSCPEWFAELAPPGMLPAAVFELGARIRTPPEEASGLPAAVRIPTRGGRCAILEGAALEGTLSGSIVVTIREASAGEVFDLLSLTYDLTRRERELVALVLDGRSTKQLAEAMGISAYTVQDHLKTIFAKTGVRSRRELSSHLAGRAPGSVESPTRS